MRVLPFFCLLLGSCLAAPTTTESPRPSVFISDKFIKDDYVIYTAKHDIVRIFAPSNQFNFKIDFWADEWSAYSQDDSSSSSSSEEKEAPQRTLFFVEADVNNGEKTYKGLFIYKNGNTAKLLDNGRDAIANNENAIYFGAADGIYKYNEKYNRAEKYGEVKDDIIQLAFYNVTNTIYYVTANHEVFKLNAEATTSVKVPQLKDVQKLVFGYDGKIYYTDLNKNVYVFDEVDGKAPVKVEGFPDKIDNIALVDPAKGMEEGAIVLVDKDVYLAASTDAHKSIVRLESVPTAYDPKPTLIQFYAKDKKLYELNIYAILKSNRDVLPEQLQMLVDRLPSKL